MWWRRIKISEVPDYEAHGWKNGKHRRKFAEVDEMETIVILESKLLVLPEGKTYSLPNLRRTVELPEHAGAQQDY